MKILFNKVLGAFRGANAPAEAPASAIRQDPTLEAAAASLPPIPRPKPPNKQQTIPSFRTQAQRSASLLTRTDRGLANTDITTFRNGTDTRSILNNLARSNPDLAATVNAYLRVGIPDTYTIIARDFDGQVNVEATKRAQEVMRRMTFVGDPTLGYNPTTDLQSVSESMGIDLLLTGSMASELVLNKQRIPSYIQPVSTTKLQFREDDTGVYPVQVIAGNEIKLDIPTFFYISVDQDLLSAYSDPYLQSSIQAVLADSQFMNDIRKSMQRVIQPRLVATIIEEKVERSVSPDIRNDPEKLGQFYNELITNLTDMLSDLTPESALVGLDAVEYEMLGSTGTTGSSGILKIVQEIISSKLLAGAKTSPAVLGRDGQASSATTSTMLFMKNANILRIKLNQLYSRIMTTAVRLLGDDVYVEFQYAALDLRPTNELEAYLAMRQSRILELLSLNLITMEEAAIQLTGNLPPAGAKDLAGTMFKNNSAATVVNPDSQTSTMNKGGAKDNLAPSTPSKPKGK